MSALLFGHSPASKSKVKAKKKRARKRQPQTTPSIYEHVRAGLVARGWKLERDPEENELEMPLEFRHPTTGERMAWIDALAEQYYAREGAPALEPR